MAKKKLKSTGQLDSVIGQGPDQAYADFYNKNEQIKQTRVAQQKQQKVQKEKQVKQKQEASKPVNRAKGFLGKLVKGVGAVGVGIVKDVAGAVDTVADAGAMITPAGRAVREKQQEVSNVTGKQPNKLKGLFKQGKINKQQYQEGLKKTGELDKKLSKQFKTEAEQSDPKKILGASAELASLAVAPEAKGIVTGAKAGAKELAKRSAVFGGAGAVGSAGATLKDNPDASAKELEKAALLGAGTGAVIPIVGAAGGKVVRKVASKVKGEPKLPDSAPPNEIEALAQKNQKEAVIPDFPDVETSDLSPKPTPVKVVPTKESQKAQAETAKIEQKTADEVKKIDQQADLIKAKQKDSGKSSEVDKVKLSQLDERKQELVPEPKYNTKNVEMVSTDELSKYMQHDRGTSPLMSKENYAKLRDDIQKNGIKEPLILNYGAKDSVASLGEGNHRLAIAKELGIKELPVEVTGTSHNIETLSGKGYAKVSGSKPDVTGYVPSNQKPSDIGVKTAQPTQITKTSPELEAIREAPSPAESKPSEKTPLTPDGKKSEAGHGSGQKPDTEATSRVYERLKAEHPDELTDDLSREVITMKGDAQKAVDLLEKDKNEAFRVAMGTEPSKDVTSTTTNIAMFEKAMDEGNYTLANRLIKNRSLAQTRRGQELNAEKASITDNSTSRYVKELLGYKMERLGKKYLSGVELGKKGSTAQRVTKTIDQEVSKVEKQIKARKLDTKTALALLDKMECLP